MSDLSTADVQAYFDRDVEHGRPLAPSPDSVSGLGSYLKYRQAAALMASDAVKTVLDIGCNRGSIEALFHSLYPEKAHATSVDGIDISKLAIAQAISLGLPNCRFRHYPGGRLPYESSQFDLVILVEVIEHVPEQGALLAEISRVLKPGGRLFLTTPNPGCWALKAEAAFWQSLRFLLRRPNPHKDAFLSREALAKLAAEAGLEPTGSDPHYEWPHAFFYFQGWSVFPPMPPRMLFRYQQMWLRELDLAKAPAWWARRIGWTLSGLWRRPGHIASAARE